MSIFGIVGLGMNKIEKFPVPKTLAEEDMIQTLKHMSIPEHNLITVSYILSIFCFCAIVASIPVIVCLVNKSPNFFPEDRHIPLNFRDYDLKNSSNKKGDDRS